MYFGYFGGKETSRRIISKYVYISVKSPQNSTWQVPIPNQYCLGVEKFLVEVQHMKENVFCHHLSLLNVNICYFNLCGVSQTYCNSRISTKKCITKTSVLLKTTLQAVNIFCSVYKTKYFFTFSKRRRSKKYPKVEMAYNSGFGL